jgi:hypothetical protein
LKLRNPENKLPWSVGGNEPNVNVSNSTESILYLAVLSAIIGLAISFAVLHIACEIRYSKSKTENTWTEC